MRLTKLLVPLVSLLAALPVHGDVCGNPAWYPYMEGYGRIGQYRSGGGGNFFFPLVQNQWGLMFGEGRSYGVTREFTAGYGLGVRQFFSPCMAWGVNGFVDYSRSKHGNDWWQGSLGGELFGPYWEARINGYHPQRKRRTVDRLNDSGLVIDGNQIFQRTFFCQVDEQAYRGFDGEVGYIHEMGCCGRFRAYAGGYWFAAHSVRNVCGPRLRLNYEFDNFLEYCGSRLILGGEWQYDRVRGSKWTGVIGLRIPLGYRESLCCPRSSIVRRMGDIVHREIGSVILKDKTKTILSETPHGNIYFVGGRSEGDGTQENPTTLQDAIKRAKAGDYIFLLNEGLPIDLSKIGTLQLKQGQTLLGFGGKKSAVIQAGPYSLTITDQLNSGRATLLGREGNDVVRAADAVAIRGVAMIGGERGIVADHTRGVVIDDVHIRETRKQGIALSGSNRASVHASSVSYAGGHGIVADHSNDIRLTDVVIRSSEGDAFRMSRSRNAVLVDGVIAHNQGAGLFFEDVSGKIRVENTTLRNNHDSIALRDGSASISLVNNIIVNEGGSLIDIKGGANVFSVIGGELSNTLGQGISIQDTVGGSISITDPVVKGSAHSAVAIRNTDAPVWISGGEIAKQTASPVDIGIQVDGAHALVSFDGTSVVYGGGTLIDVVNGDGRVEMHSLGLESHKGKGIRLHGNSGPVVVTDLNFVGKESTVIEISGNQGRVRVQGGSIDNRGGMGVAVTGAMSEIAFRSTEIEQQGGVLFAGNDIPSGSIAFIGGDLTSRSGVAVEAAECHGSLAFDNLTIDRPTKTAVTLNNVGEFTLRNGEVVASDHLPLLASGIDTIDVSGTYFGGLSQGRAIDILDGVNVRISDNDFHGMQNGLGQMALLKIQSVNESSVVNIEGNRVHRPDGVFATLQTSQRNDQVAFNVTNNTIESAHIPERIIEVIAIPGVPEHTHRPKINISGNSISTPNRSISDSHFIYIDRDFNGPLEDNKYIRIGR